MHGDMVSELRLAALYANEVARAIVRMGDRLSNFFTAMRSTHNTFVIDVLGTLGLEDVMLLVYGICLYVLISCNTDNYCPLFLSHDRLPPRPLVICA